MAAAPERVETRKSRREASWGWAIGIAKVQKKGASDVQAMQRQQTGQAQPKPSRLDCQKPKTKSRAGRQGVKPVRWARWGIEIDFASHHDRSEIRDHDLASTSR
jgi:hypothetical protein